MSIFKEMDPELARCATEGYQDVLTEELSTQQQFYQRFSCPRCRASLTPEFDPRTCYTGDNLIAKAVLRCDNCAYCIDPHTNVVVVFGDASRTPVEDIMGGRFLRDDE